MFALSNHPFAVEAYFNTSLVLTYAARKSELKAMIPSFLELDLFKDEWAFIAVALVDTKQLRPKGFPKFFGRDFLLIGYRIFVRYHNKAGKNLRGLYILKSETNKTSMSRLGNIFTHYHYETTDIRHERNHDTISISSVQSALDIEVAINKNPVPLPLHSPFENWKEARRFAGPLPFTFTHLKKSNGILIIEGVRENWEPQPVKVIRATSGFIDQKKINGLVLANAFLVENIPYYWKKGKTETWT